MRWLEQVLEPLEDLPTDHQQRLTAALALAPGNRPDHDHERRMPPRRRRRARRPPLGSNSPATRRNRRSRPLQPAPPSAAGLTRLAHMPDRLPPWRRRAVGDHRHRSGVRRPFDVPSTRRGSSHFSRAASGSRLDAPASQTDAHLDSMRDAHPRVVQRQPARRGTQGSS